MLQISRSGFPINSLNLDVAKRSQPEQSCSGGQPGSTVSLLYNTDALRITNIIFDVHLQHNDTVAIVEYGS